MAGQLKVFFKVFKWPYICISEIIGLAGVPGDLALWGRTMTPLLEWLDASWIARAFLVLSGLLVLTYSRWKPHLLSVWRKLPSLSVADDLNNELEELKRNLSKAQDDRDQYRREVANEKEQSAATQAALRAAETLSDQYKQQLKKQDEELSKLRGEYRTFKRDHGRWRIFACGRELGKSLKLSVAILYVDHQDSKLAEKIYGLFHPFIPGTPWMETQPKRNILDFDNPSSDARIVIFSDHPNAGGIKDAFNHCELLDEPVKLFEKTFARGNIPDVDIAIVIFPSKGTGE